MDFEGHLVATGTPAAICTAICTANFVRKTFESTGNTRIMYLRRNDQDQAWENRNMLSAVFLSFFLPFPNPLLAVTYQLLGDQATGVLG